MATADQVRWGLLGAAGIASSQFLPALREAGEGRAVLVGARDGGRAERWATEFGIDRGVEGYKRVLADPDVDAVYVALPNSLHAEWTVAALEAGKAVLCEKPLCATADETERVLAVAAGAPGPLWEAFVFPFHEQIRRVGGLIAEGRIGEPREIWSRFHFLLDDPHDIRMSAALGGGATQDVGCYSIRLARLLFDGEPDRPGVTAGAVWTGGVDEELWGIVPFGGDRWMQFSCGFRSPYDTFARVIGSEGEIRMTNPFHPDDADTFELVSDGEVVERALAMPSGERSFTAAIRHIHRVLLGEEEPTHLAVDDALGNATAIEAVLSAARATVGRGSAR
jgi:predicted dehydrogenase